MFMYGKIPFGLMNTGATFQRDIDIDFISKKENCVVIYLDDITFFSKYYVLFNILGILDKFYV